MRLKIEHVVGHNSKNDAYDHDCQPGCNDQDDKVQRQEHPQEQPYEQEARVGGEARHRRISPMPLPHVQATSHASD
jgi:hypothetical protein